MATAEAASLGPRYAPDDPTLPKPWKGLIDGSTGLLYYWNPETNITQYERPAVLPPPLPPGLPPAVSTPKLAPIPVAHSMQPNGVLAQMGQKQVAQGAQQQGQQMSLLPQQRGQAMGQQQQGSMVVLVQDSDQQGSQPLNSQTGQPIKQPGQFIPQQNQPQIMQHSNQQMMSQMGQQMPQLPNQHMQQQHPNQHMPQQQPNQHMPQEQGQHPQQLMTQQAIHQMPQQLEQQRMQHQNSQVEQPQGPQYANQHMRYIAYQQSVHPQVQQSSQQPAQIGAQGQQYNLGDYKAAVPKREDVDFRQGNHVGFSPSQFQQMGTSSSQNHSVETNSVQMPQTGSYLGQAQQFMGSSLNMQQSATHLQQTGTDLVHQQQGHRFQNQIGPSVMQSNMPNPGLNTGYEDNLHGRARNDYYFNGSKDGPLMGPQKPSLSAIPAEMGMSGIPPQNVIPGHGGGFNAIAGQTMHNMYGRAGPPYSNNNLMPPFAASSDTANLSPAEAYRKQHEVTATGDNVPAPFIRFEDTGFPPEILREVRFIDAVIPSAISAPEEEHMSYAALLLIHSAGFSSPTPIQAQTWPIALQSQDIVATAKTGSGKTLGYLIPAFIHLRQCHNNPQNGPTVLVLAPTRELATQIQEEAIKFGRSSRVSCTCLYGGASKAAQLKELDRGADIVVATPGRLNDILEMKKIDFGQVSFLVLDEADRMLDMGFEPQIRKIVKEIPPRRQTLMYTATWPKEVRNIACDLLVNPVQVNVGSVDELAANKAITQYVEVVPQMEKERRLGQILQAQERGSKVIIFCSTKRLCDQLARGLGHNFGAVAFHGDKSQNERDWVLSQFRSGKSPILVATDVAARGLDIKDIRVVINYDFPNGIEDYVHRIGRTGRAGATGVSYTFFSEQDWKYAPDLILVLERANQHVPPEIREIASRGGPGFGKDRGGISRFTSSSGNGGRWDSGGRGSMRDGGFTGRGGMRDGGFAGRGGMRDGGFAGRGGLRDGGFNDAGGRGDSFSGRGNRGRGFGGHVGWGRNERGMHDRYNSFDGRGRGRGRGRFDNRRGIADRSRDRSYSRSPERVRRWRYSRSRSHSRSRSRSRSWSRSRSRSHSRDRSRSYSHSPRRSYSRSRSRSRSRSYSRGRSRSRSLSYDRYEKPKEQNIDQNNVAKSEFDDAPVSVMSPMSPGTQDKLLPESNSIKPLQAVESSELLHREVGADQAYQSVSEP